MIEIYLASKRTNTHPLEVKKLNSEVLRVSSSSSSNGNSSIRLSTKHLNLKSFTKVSSQCGRITNFQRNSHFVCISIQINVCIPLLLKTVYDLPFLSNCNLILSHAHNFYLFSSNLSFESFVFEFVFVWFFVLSLRRHSCLSRIEFNTIRSVNSSLCSAYLVAQSKLNVPGLKFQFVVSYWAVFSCFFLFLVWAQRENSKYASGLSAVKFIK